MKGRINKAGMKEYDVVRLTDDIPHVNLCKGMEGTIVMVFDEPGKPLAFEVEFVDSNGKTIAVETIKKKYLEKIWSKNEEK